MENFNHPQIHEEFLHEPSKMTELFEHLNQIISSTKMDERDGMKKKAPEESKDISADVTDNNFFVSHRARRMRRSSGKQSSRAKRFSCKNESNTNQFTFMRQIDQTEEERVIARKERLVIAMNFRRLGNYEYRKEQYQSANELYTNGLDYVNDSPVLYCNRACCFIKQRKFKRALMDCDYVINNLDSKCLQAWLYRSLIFKRLNEERNFQECLYQVNRLGGKNTEVVEKFLEKMRTCI